MTSLFLSCLVLLLAFAKKYERQNNGLIWPMYRCGDSCIKVVNCQLFCTTPKSTASSPDDVEDLEETFGVAVGKIWKCYLGRDMMQNMEQWCFAVDTDFKATRSVSSRHTYNYHISASIKTRKAFIIPVSLGIVILAYLWCNKVTLMHIECDVHLKALAADWRSVSKFSPRCHINTMILYRNRTEFYQLRETHVYALYGW